MNNLIEEILKVVRHKEDFKTTTTLKFKKDMAEILLNTTFEGDILEIGTNNGNTTVILAAIGDALGKKVYSFDYEPVGLKMAEDLCSTFEANCNLILKDVYKEEWELSNIGCVLIDCIHTEDCLRMDLENAEKVGRDNQIIFVHDYGLITSSGRKLGSIFDGNKGYDIVRFLGEKNEWNKLGSAQVVDWEGVQVKFSLP